MIKYEGVTHIYKNSTVALNNVNLEIKKGEFVFLVGSSGAGKSTVIKMLTKEVDPTRGSIYIYGKDLKSLSKKQIPHYRRKIGMVFQDFRLIPTLTIYENVAFALRVTMSQKKYVKRKVSEALNLVGLSKKEKMYPNELSGGEQQRVALARAIVNKPEIIIADEPTGNLDPETSKGIMELLQEINESGTTIIMATHDKNIVNSMKKRVITIEEGSKIKDEAQGEYEI